MDYSAVADIDLRARFVETAEILRSVTAERKLIAVELERRDRSAAAKARLAVMSEADRDALREALK